MSTPADRPNHRPLTYRVQEIPGSWNKQQVKDAFSSTDQPYITVKSLVPDVMNYGYHNEDGTDSLTATILFSPPEPREPMLDDEWSADIELDKDFSGFTPLNDPKRDVSGDIIAVTGLAGHAFGSWASSPSRMWLRDFLPSTIPNSRVLIYGYRALVQGSNQPKSILADHADTFMNDLLTIRSNPACQDRPIILIGHSLGGLIIKEVGEALRLEVPFLTDRQFIVNLEEEVRHRLPIRSLVFFGVPHLGLETNGSLPSMVKGQPSQTLVEELNRDSPTITSLSRRFMRVLRDAPFAIHSLYESQATKTVTKNDTGKWVREGASVVMVPHSSAVLRHEREKHTLSVQGDHSSMVKLKKGQGSCYPSVAQWIKEDLKNATEIFNGLHKNNQESKPDGSDQVEQGKESEYDLIQLEKLEETLERRLSLHEQDHAECINSRLARRDNDPKESQPHVGQESPPGSPSLGSTSTEALCGTQEPTSAQDTSSWPPIRATGPWIGCYKVEENTGSSHCDICQVSFGQDEAKGDRLRCLICSDFDFHESCLKEKHGNHKADHKVYGVSSSWGTPNGILPSHSCIPIVPQQRRALFFLLTDIAPARYSVVIYLFNTYSSYWRNIRDAGNPTGAVGIPRDLGSFLKIASSEDLGPVSWTLEELFSSHLTLGRRHLLEGGPMSEFRYSLDPGPGHTIVIPASGLLGVYIDISDYKLSKTQTEGLRIYNVSLHRVDDIPAT